MVVLTVSPFRGNHTRFFPFAGYLGLTPVVVQGQVRTMLEEDQLALRSACLCVRIRCYEADLTRGKRLNVLYEISQELWRKDGEREWGELGDFSSPFRLVIPVDAIGVSTTTFKSFRTWWQVEAGELTVILLLLDGANNWLLLQSSPTNPPKSSVPDYLFHTNSPSPPSPPPLPSPPQSTLHGRHLHLQPILSGSNTPSAPPRTSSVRRK